MLGQTVEYWKAEFNNYTSTFFWFRVTFNDTDHLVQRSLSEMFLYFYILYRNSPSQLLANVVEILNFLLFK